MTEQMKIEIMHWQNGGSNFTSWLFTLIQKADRVNLEKIRLGFPDEVAAIEEWARTGISARATYQEKGGY